MSTSNHCAKKLTRNRISRVASIMKLKERRLITSAFMHLFSLIFYCRVVWIFHNRNLNDRINKIQERVVSFVHRDFKCTFREQTSKDNSSTLQQNNLQKVAAESFKVKIVVAPVIIGNVSDIVHSVYYLRNETKFRSKNNAAKCGTETLSHIEPKIWNRLTNDCKRSTTVEEGKVIRKLPVQTK